MKIGMNNNTQLNHNNVQSFAQCGFEKCKHYFRNRSPHQSLIAAPQTARATFIFTVESFNARDHFDEVCPMCDREKDCAEHIPECTDIECRNIIEETQQIIQNKFKPEDINIGTNEYNEWWHRIEKGLFKPHEANLCDLLWQPISKMHKLIWDLRVQKRKEKQKEKPK